MLVHGCSIANKYYNKLWQSVELQVVNLQFDSFVFYRNNKLHALDNLTPLLGMTPNELKDVAAALGLKPFVGKQMADWIYKSTLPV